jgi:hypothetical protein
MPDLAYAMKVNPAMKVLLTGGYYDLVTPFFEGIYEMHHCSGGSHGARTIYSG